VTSELTAAARAVLRDDGASGTHDGDWACLQQESSLHRVLTNVDVDASTFAFRAVLAPVGEVVLIEGSGSTTREAGRFVVPTRDARAFTRGSPCRLSKGAGTQPCTFG
jgi:hypothetical protein